MGSSVSVLGESVGLPEGDSDSEPHPPTLHKLGQYDLTVSFSHSSSMSLGLILWH